jgi:transcriptional regulator with XRE-family HTH domain
MTVTKAARQLEGLVFPKPETTQAEIARLCNVSPQAVSGWINGRSKPTPDRMRLLKDRFGIPMEAWTEVEGGEPEANPTQPEPATGAAERVVELDESPADEVSEVSVVVEPEHSLTDPKHAPSSNAPPSANAPKVTIPKHDKGPVPTPDPDGAI